MFHLKIRIGWFGSAEINFVAESIYKQDIMRMWLFVYDKVRTKQEKKNIIYIFHTRVFLIHVSCH